MHAHYKLNFLRGVLHLLPQKAQKLTFLCFIAELSTSFWKMIYASYSKLSKELINSIKIKVGQAVLELLIKNNILTVLICNLKIHLAY